MDDGRLMDSTAARALAMFDEFADMPHHRQSRALARLEQEDPAAHAALVELLVADALEHRLDTPPLEVLARDIPRANAPHESRCGTRLGPWRIGGLLSVGGMGTVYEAYRADGQYEQRVALKCIRAELSSPQLVEAFRNERRYLAQLEHPHIAALLDGGVEVDGTHWFAMQYVDGQGIEQWCDQRDVSVAERVRLLVQACDALAYAHRCHVVHQDIKPDNLLVTPQGHVFLVDFGISASLAGGGQSQRIAISNGYAAPEAHTGAPPDFTSDVYGMGVVMYRLLCGDWPVPLHPMHARIMQKPEPPRAMRRLLDSAPAAIARQRGLPHNRALSRLLADGLESIASRCVATDPAARYPDATALRDDLERWLQRRPVMAHGNGLGYRLECFLRRNAAACTLGALASVTLLSAVVLLGVQYRQNTAQVEASAQVTALLERVLGSATLSGLGESRMSSRQLLAQTEASLRALPLDEQPLIRSRALLSLARNYAMLGDYAHALSLVDESSRRLQAASDRVQIQTTRAVLLNLMARHAEAREAVYAGIELASHQGKADAPASNQLLCELARAQWGLSEHEAALATLALARQSLASLPEAVRRSGDAELLILQGQWQGERYRLVEARSDLQRAITLASPVQPLLVEDAHEQMAVVLGRMGHEDEATALLRSTADERRRRLGDTHPGTVHAMRMLAEALVAQGQTDEAARILTSIRMAGKVFEPGHPEAAHLLRVEGMIASQRQPGAGVPLAREAVAALERILGPLHEQTLEAKTDLADQLMALAATRDSASARLLLRTEAIGLLHEAVHTAQRRHLPAPGRRLELAEALQARGQPQDGVQAERLLQDALVEAHRYLGPRHPLTARIRARLVGHADS